MSEGGYRKFVLAAVAVAAVAASLGAIYLKRKTIKEKGLFPPKIPGENTTVVASSPTDEEATTSAAASRVRGNKYFNAGRFEDAIKCYSESIASYPVGHFDLSLAYANRAAAYLSLKNYPAALSDCESALYINPKFVKALDRRSRVLELTGETEDALVDAVAAAVVDQFKTDSYFMHIEELLKTLSEAKAKELYAKRKPALSSAWVIKHFLRSFPREWKKIEAENFGQNGELESFLGLIVDDEFNKAYEEIQKFAATSPESCQSELYNWLGTMHFLSGNFESAREALKKSISLDPNSVSPRVKLALVAMELGHYMDMTESLDSALKIDDTDASIFYHRGEIFALSNNMEAAISDFSRAIQLDPEFLDAYVHQARAYLSLEMLDAAKEFVSKSLKLFPEHPELLHVMGECLAMEGKYEESLDLFQKVERLSPDFPQVLLNKAIIMHMHGGSTEQLGQQLQEIVGKFPHFDAAHVQLAGYHLENKRIDEALHHYDIAAEHARSYQELVTIYTIRSISSSQAKVAEKYPELASSIQYA